MELVNLREFLEEELTYPIDKAAVVTSVGGVEIEAPDARNSEAIAAIIGPHDDGRYGSAGELFEDILGNVGDAFIGRKFYDDRGDNPLGPNVVPTHESNRSL